MKNSEPPPTRGVNPDTSRNDGDNGSWLREVDGRLCHCKVGISTDASVKATSPQSHHCGNKNM